MEGHAEATAEPRGRLLLGVCRGREADRDRQWGQRGAPISEARGAGALVEAEQVGQAVARNDAGTVRPSVH